MNSNGRPPALTLERAASLERLARARFFAYSQKRTMPPRINPVGIMLLILTAGIIFIGLTITIVANWPGLASLGENRLKIAGPVILGLGFLGCLATIIFLCLWVSEQNRKWEIDMTERAQKFINSSQSQEPLVDSYQYLPSQKNGRQPGEHIMVINNLPRKNLSSPDASDSFESQKDLGGIPKPVRVQKKRSSSSKGQDVSKGSSNLSFSAGEGDMSIPGVSFGSPRGTNQHTNGRPSRISAHTSNNEIERYTRLTKTTTRTTRIINPEDTSVDPIRRALDRGRSSYDQPNQSLRVLIRANSNTAIHITPSSTPTTGGHPTRMSMDTEI